MEAIGTECKCLQSIVSHSSYPPCCKHLQGIGALRHGRKLLSSLSSRSGHSFARVLLLILVGSHGVFKR